MITLINALKLGAGAILGGVVVYSYVQAYSLPAARRERLPFSRLIDRAPSALSGMTGQALGKAAGNEST